MQESLNAARVLMGDSLGFHIIFVLFGLTLPILVVWFEWLGIRTKNKKYTDTAKFWSKIMALLVITGVISGTVVALQMSLVWPGILKFGGEVIGLPFMLETYFFLIEATFLGLYMLTWDNKKVPPMLHLFFGVMVAFGANASAFVITSVNAWMNNPTGFELVDGKFQHVEPVGAMFSQTSLVQFVHSMPAYYFAASTAIVGLYAAKLLRAKYKDRMSARHAFDWVIVKRLMLFAAVMLVALFITADITGKYLAKHEPSKLAALELTYETDTNVPLVVGGVASGDESIAGPHFKIPNGLSVLAGNSPGTEVKGLNEFAKSVQPPLYIHTLFDIKMTIITFLAVAIPAYFAMRKWKPEWLTQRWALFIMAAGGWLGIVLVELGWMITEIGRQPWAVRGYVTTSQALTTHDVRAFGWIFPTAYVALGVVTVLALRKIVVAQNQKGKGGR
ncbi:cytochrome ubiquinol oxidase subunit I [Candidatus Saccharibacteria bacterium]|nr:cytochrome ubiquinol oxidase subunit I [Candidatus Saccharibacteria bacterium]